MVRPRLSLRFVGSSLVLFSSSVLAAEPAEAFSADADDLAAHHEHTWLYTEPEPKVVYRNGVLEFPSPEAVGTYKDFTNLVLNGTIFLVRGFATSKTFPDLMRWDCDFFRKEFPQVGFFRSYAVYIMSDGKGGRQGEKMKKSQAEVCKKFQAEVFRRSQKIPG